MMRETEVIYRQCGKGNRPGAKFCKYCGAKLPQAMGEQVAPGKNGVLLAG